MKLPALALPVLAAASTPLFPGDDAAAHPRGWGKMDPKQPHPAHFPSGEERMTMDPVQDCKVRQRVALSLQPELMSMPSPR
jgi:hypothetical protein